MAVAAGVAALMVSMGQGLVEEQALLEQQAKEAIPNRLRI
jgi:hypothetical protein